MSRGRLLLAVLLLAGTEAYFFESGYSHHYTYWAENSLFGEKNVTTVLKFQIHHLNDTENGHRLHSLTVDSLVQFVKDGQVKNNPLNWDLKKAFLFVVDEKGTVTLVHCPPEDHEELVFIKKAMVSVFSVHVKVEEGADQWSYTVQEKDHLGDLQHDYNVQQTSEGLWLMRNHYSSADALRFHEKTLHFDQRGTLHTAEAKDRVLLKDRSSKTSKSLPLPGELPHKIDVSGDFPDIETSAVVKVKLDGKRPSLSPVDVFHNLTTETLLTIHKEKKHALEAVRANISRNFDCFLRYPERDDVNRSLCINDLRKVLHGLHPNELKDFGNSILGNSCHVNNTACEDRRLIVIDIVARIGDVTSQQLLLSHVLTKRPSDDEELRRVFMHCVALEAPTENFVRAIVAFCFGDQDQHHGSTSMTRTQSRACLAVGTLTKQLDKGGRHRLANRIASKLETWVEEHKKDDHKISKRDTWLEDTEHEDHHLSKAVLLHALGNAALPRSRRHLLEHAQPNRGHHMWRRAALDAMRHYTCTETAEVTLDCLTNDEKHSVRQMALSVYVKHPKRHEVSKHMENDMLSQNYTYPAVVRVKRDMFEKVLFKFKLDLPKVDWKKELGSKTVGASFGLTFNNYVDALFKVLSGYVDVNIHDKLWAEIHVGAIGKQWDILLIEACYRGRLSYNMNIVKDFTVGLFEDIASAFDHIATRIIEPVAKAANELATQYQDPSSNEPKSGFEPLASAVKNLPEKTEGALTASIDLTKAAGFVKDLPLVNQIQQLAGRAQSLMEDIHSEATDFFTNVKDTAVVALPFAEKEIRQAINTVLDKLGQVTTAPNQVFAFIQRAQMGYQLAMKRILEGNIEIKQALSFLTGSRSTFMNAGHEVQDIVQTLRELVGRLKADHSRRKREADPFDEFGQTVITEVDAALSGLISKADALEEHLLNVSDSAKEVQEGFDKQALYIEVLKTSFQSLREAIDMVKSRVHAVFGLKFHTGFPNQRRECDGTCGCGYFPTVCTRYGHPGVDLKWEPGWKIRSPVAGMMYPAWNNSVRIEPKTAGFEEYEILLSNIILLVPLNDSGVFVDAGQNISTPIGTNGCEDSHFHLAMKRKPSNFSSGLCYYVDPSPFLDRIQPIPTWHQECKEFTFKHIGNVVDFHKLTNGFTEFLEELKRIVLDVAKELLVKAVDQLPDDGFLGVVKGYAKDFVKNLDLNDPSNLKNLVQNATNQMKEFYKDISTRNFNFSDITKIANQVAALSGNAKIKESVARVTDFITDARDLIKQPSLGKLGSVATGSLERLLSTHGVKSPIPDGLKAFFQGLAKVGNESSVASLLGETGLAFASRNEQGFISLLGNIVRLGSENRFGNATDFLTSLANLGDVENLGKAPALLRAFGNLGLRLSSRNQNSSDSELEIFLQSAQDLWSVVKPNDTVVSTGLAFVTSFVAGRQAMLTTLKTTVGKLCPKFKNALATSPLSVCMPHEDCLGIDCDVTVKNAFVSGTINVTLRVQLEEKKLQITANGMDSSVIADGQQIVAAKLIVLRIFEVKFKVNASWKNKTLTLSLSVLACTKFGERCLVEIPLMKNIEFDFSTRRRKRSLTELLGPILSKVESLPIDDLQKLFSDFSLPLKDLVGQIGNIQESISSELQLNEDKTQQDLKPEFKNPKELKDNGAYPLPGQKGEIYIPFFKFVYRYPIGPILLGIDFEAGGAIGLAFDVKIQAIDSMLKVQIKPFVVGKLEATLSVSIIIVSAGITLHGYVLRTSFPLSLAANYTQQPIVATKSLDVELIPIELKLEGWVKIGVWIFSVTFRKIIWHWRADPITGNIWKKEHRKDDLGPPRFPYCDRVSEQCVDTSRSRRSAVNGGGGSFCYVDQVPGRHPKDTAFRLQFTADDEDSALQLWYAVGDYPGDTNVAGWTEIRGGALTIPAELPCGIPLYFTVRARNSQGLETTATCSVSIDCTFPDGRVDAAYRCSSHPRELAANVIMFEDSQLKPDRLFHGVGYSPSSYGHEVVDWQPLTLSNSQPQPGVSGDLRQFSSPRPGRLSSLPKQTLQAASATTCASRCLKLTTCVSFSYNQYVQTCELQEVTEGPSAERKPEENYETYDRLGISLTAALRYTDLPLRHGIRYYVNADVENVLGYHSTLTSQGTMVDFTPPEPGPVGQTVMDTLVAGGCNVSVLQRCVNAVKSSKNHWKLVDGKGGSTVFNGNRRGQELIYTIENYHAAANWDGFKDRECGIHGYTFAVGTTVCGTDIAGFTDPHVYIDNPNDWTNTGLVKNIHLPDGKYYVTVQAVSDIVHGGDLVTTVCHSTPFIVDTQPPILHGVDAPLFDEGFRMLVVYFSASDNISGVARIEFGLGKTKYDVSVRRYLPFEIRGAERTYLVNEEFGIGDGMNSWIRLKVINNVGLFVTGSSSGPIMIDNTAPIAGQVLDGAEPGQDICCQMITTQICAHWTDFHDPESGIASYFWGVGHAPGKDDVVRFHSLSSYVKVSCEHVQLQHNVTYFSTVIANNGALNQKSTNASSSGVLVDATPPVAGNVSDGEDVNNDQDFTSEAATLSVSWAGFYDPESGLKPYSLSVFVNGGLLRVLPEITDEKIIDHSFSFQHGDRVHTELLVSNRAGGTVTDASDGLLVDHTPPELVRLSTVSQRKFQTVDNVLDFIFEFQDPESGVAEYRCAVYENSGGRRSRFWPQREDVHLIYVNDTSSLVQNVHLDQLRLENGGAYSLKVTAVNRAHLSVAGESEGVTVDTTPPSIDQVTLVRPGEQEEVNDNDEVEIVDREPIWISWKPRDIQSGIQESRLCIGDASSATCMFTTTNVRTISGDLPFVTSFQDMNLTVSTEDLKVLYRVYVTVVNGAGMSSTVARSKPFFLLRANVPGTVLDGRGIEDMEFSRDKSSIAMTFSGFSSEACGIVGYEWGIGTAPYNTDVISFTRFGLVVNDQGRGVAQAHVTQFEGQTYYSTVRAKTGPNCHDEYIVSSSSGFTLDTTPPSVRFQVNARLVASRAVVYQKDGASLAVGWEVQDSSGSNNTELSMGVFEARQQTVSVPPVSIRPFTLSSHPSSGDSIYSALVMTDKAGNMAETMLPVITFDYTPPSFQELSCTSVISAVSSILSCTWSTVDEKDSALSEIQFGLGTGPASPSLLNLTSVALYSRRWSTDVQGVIDLKTYKELYILARAVNGAALENDVTSSAVKFVVDATPPELTSVSVVTSLEPGFHDTEQRCQTTQDYLEIFLKGLADTESGVESVEIALGSAKGRTDVRPFRQYHPVSGMCAMGRLGLNKGSTVFVTVKVTNGVGLYTVGTSEGVAISPEPRLEVWDGAGDTDMDGQPEFHVIQGQWRYSDACPVLVAEWSVRELSGAVVSDFSNVPGNSRVLYDDDVDLENLKTYVNYVRITDALNRTFTAFSDGITVMLQRPEPATVRDGLGSNDVDFQESTDQLSANWDAFGDALSTLPSDHIVRYEAAVGTDRKNASTRSDVHAFEDVRLATEVTFHGLNLTAKTATYYVTVRAHSGAGSYVESSSDGVKVGFSSDFTPGQVQADRFQSSVSDIRFTWTEFESDMEITHYYAGVSTTAPPWDNKTHMCSELFDETTFLFDVRQVEILEDQSMAVFTNLTLVHGGAYFVTVVAADDFGHCSAAISDNVLVDTTPPVTGDIRVDKTVEAPLVFLRSPQYVSVELDEFRDPESGIQESVVELFVSEECMPSLNTTQMKSLARVEAKNEPSLSIRGLELQEGATYFLRLAVTNGAGLISTSTSRPLILDVSPPATGEVKLGSDWTKDSRAFQNKTDQVELMLALSSAITAEGCVTKIDLFSSESKKLWRPLKGDVFAEECAGFDNSGLHVLVQHNSHLTGVDRGATRFADTFLREGDFVFSLSPATGEKIMSGISLASPTLAPPFLYQNGLAPGDSSSMPCEPSNSTCLSKKGKASSESATLPDSDFGVGLTFIEYNGETRLLFWAQDILQLQQTWLPLDFDPAGVAAEYVLSFEKSESSQVSWTVTVSVNGQPEVSASGLIFPEELVISVYTWNVNGFFPAVRDPFNPYRATTLVTSITVPVAERPLCSYGSPFYDAVSGIKEIWIGVSDSLNVTANVAPFQLVQTFCLKCPKGCASICPPCNENPFYDSFKVFSFIREGLSLQATNVSLQNYSTTVNASVSSNITSGFNWTKVNFDDNIQLATYFVDVRVVDHGGSSAEAKSNSFIVDTTPPYIGFLRIFDPAYSMEEPTFFLGNNRSVAVQWDVTEDVTNIISVEISVGSAPERQDVAPKITVSDVVRKYTFTDIWPRLTEDEMFYITLEVTNEAGLFSKTWANFTVHTTPPNMAVVSPSMTNVTMTTVSGVTVGFLEDTEHLQMTLDLETVTKGNVYIDYYEWAIGTREGTEDIFPRTVVGPKETRRIAIVDGYFQSEFVPDNVSIAYFTKRNFSSDMPPDPSGNKFMMEPGRCIYQTLYGASKAHVVSSKKLAPVCIKRTHDLLVAPDTPSQEISIGRANESTSLKVNIDLSKGGLVVGPLSRSDLDSQYGSSASTEFSPYIVPPDPADATSRYLRKRLRSIPGPEMFLSPVANADFEGDVKISYTAPEDLDLPESSRVNLILWNPYTGEWVTPEELCPGAANQTAIVSSDPRSTSATFCPELFSRKTDPSSKNSKPSMTPARRKRNVIEYSPAINSQSLGPRMITVGIINSTVTNEAPVVQNTTFSMIEDQGTYRFEIIYTDAERDEVKFTLDSQPGHGTAEITQDGHLLYTPVPNFNGTDFVQITGIEIIDAQTQALGIVPNVIRFTLTAVVTSFNDPPQLIYIPAPNSSEVWQARLQGPTSGNGINMSVLIEVNVTTRIRLGVIAYGDVDKEDAAAYLDNVNDKPESKFEVITLSKEKLVLQNATYVVLSGLGGKEIFLNVSKGYAGQVTYDARVKDAAASYSLQLTLKVYVLNDPCVYGHCIPRGASRSCQETRRAFTFDPYACSCDLGYEGEWCEAEIDECRKATCSPITDCVDLLAAYRCDYNPAKLAAIIVCCGIAVLIGAFIIYGINKKKGKRKGRKGEEDDLKPSRSKRKRSDEETMCDPGRPRTPPADYNFANEGFDFESGEDYRRRHSHSDACSSERTGRSNTPPADYQFTNPCYGNVDVLQVPFPSTSFNARSSTSQTVRQFDNLAYEDSEIIKPRRSQHSRTFTDPSDDGLSTKSLDSEWTDLPMYQAPGEPMTGILSPYAGSTDSKPRASTHPEDYVQPPSAGHHEADRGRGDPRTRKFRTPEVVAGGRPKTPPADYMSPSGVMEGAAIRSAFGIPVRLDTKQILRRNAHNEPLAVPRSTHGVVNAVFDDVPLD